MTEERERAVERLTYPDLGYDFEGDLMGWLVDKDDLRLLLSERAELLATVERMRGALTRIAALQGTSGAEVTGSVSRYVFANEIARAALTTGEEK